MMHVTLTPLPSYPTNEFVGSPLGTNRIGWHLILLRARRQPLDWVATVRVSCKKNTAGTQRIRVALTLVKQVFGVKVGILFLGDCNALFRVRLQNVSDTADPVGLTLLSIPRLIAAIGVYLQNPTAFRDGVQRARGSWAARIRKGLLAAALKGQDLKNDYRLWTRYFDTWSEGHLRRILDALSARPSVSVLVFCAMENGAALAATLASVRAQTYPVAALCTATPGQVEKAVHSAAANEYVAILQAGEVLPRHALLLLVHELGRPETD